MDRILERHPLSALWGDMPSDELAAMRESVQDHGFTDPVIWTCTMAQCLMAGTGTRWRISWALS